jgi:hypothetical protein
MKTPPVLFPLAALLLIGAAATPVWAGLRYMETAHLRLVYIDGLHSFLAPHAVRCFENSYSFHLNLWGHELDGKTNVFLHDLGDQANGGAKNIPRNMIIAAIAPFNYAYETMPANERINTIMNHEVAHLYTMDRPGAWDRFFRAVFFGKPEPIAEQPVTILYDYLTSPRRSAPRWYQEGIAVFLETWMAGGYGRALGSYDEMVFRTMVHDSARFYDPVGLESEATRKDFHVGVNSYLYGTRFMSYLALQHGPEKVMEWVNRATGSRAYFMAQFRRVFGHSLDDAWRDWITYEKNFQAANLARVREYPVTPHRDLSDMALGSMSRAFLDSASRTLYAAVNYPGRIAHIAAINIDNGKSERLCDIKGASLYYASSTAYDPESHTLFYTADNYGWRDLCAVNTQTRKRQTLMKDARIGDLAFNRIDSSLWGVRHFNGMSTVVRIPFPYREWKTVYAWPYGRDIYDLDISPDGRLLSASLAYVSGRQTLILMHTDSLLAGDTSHVELYDFHNTIPQSFIFSEDGRYLYGSSYFTGVSNIFRYDLKVDSMDAMSNAETGFFRPLPVGADSAIVFRYTAAGFVPAMVPLRPLQDVNAIDYFGQQIVERHPIVTEWLAGSPGRIDVDSVVTKRGDYRIATSWHLMSLYPVVEGFKSTTAGGLRLNFADHLGLHQADVTVSYSPEENLPRDERWHVGAHYSYGAWDARFTYNKADFYDLFGPTKTSRRGYSGTLEHSRSLIYDEPRVMDLTVGAAGYWDLERLPDYQNVAAAFDELYTAWIDLHYENMTTSLGAVEQEKGIQWTLSPSGAYVNDDFYPAAVGRLDGGLPILIPHSSIWLRTAAGIAPDKKDDPFANFYFGGFGNNWVDHGKVKRYREWYSFPGLALNEVGGTNFVRVMADWNLPPLRFRRLGFPALYCAWARASIFSSALVTNLNVSDARVEVGNIGAQLDLQFQLLSQLKLTFSVGYARSYRKDQRGADETMVSLKAL